MGLSSFIRFLASGIPDIILYSAILARSIISEISAGSSFSGFSNSKKDPKTTFALEFWIASAKRADGNTKAELARQLDYFVLQALVERTDYSLLAMGRSREKGCFCPANTLLRETIDFLSDPFAAILIDAEAGLEQIQRRVTRNVTQIIAISDGSQRSREIIKHISEMVGHQKLAAVTNRVQQNTQIRPTSCELLGSIPENDILRQFDRDGKSLWELPAENPAYTAVEKITEKLGFYRQKI